MKKINFFLIIVILSIIFYSCNDKKTDDSTELIKKGTVDVVIKSSHQTNFDIITITRNIYDLRGNLIKTIINKDTIPSLGLTKDTLSYINHVGTDNEEDRDTIVTHMKDYQFFISVKK